MAGSPAPGLPEQHPAHQQMMAAFADEEGPPWTRELRPALDPPLPHNHTERVRSKPERLVSRGILTGNEPGPLARRCP